MSHVFPHPLFYRAPGLAYVDKPTTAWDFIYAGVLKWVRAVLHLDQAPSDFIARMKNGADISPAQQSTNLVRDPFDIG